MTTTKNKTRTKRTYNTEKNLRIHCDDFDIVFAFNAPHEMFLVPPHAFEVFRLTADKRKNGKYDLCVTINGRKHRAHDLLCAHAPNNLVDHISGITNDIRIVNLREFTYQQNNQNRKEAEQGKVYQHENGKFFIYFPKDEHASDTLFDTKTGATKYLYELQNKYLGDSSYRRSQEIAAKHETFLFHRIFTQLFGNDSLLEELENAPYIIGDKNPHRLNMPPIKFRLLNAEYLLRFDRQLKEYEKQLISADSEKRRKLSQTIERLRDGRYIIDLGYFHTKFEDITTSYLRDKRNSTLSLK